MARGSAEPPRKMAKLDVPLPTNVIIQFQSDTGDTVGKLKGFSLCLCNSVVLVNFLQKSNGA